MKSKNLFRLSIPALLLVSGAAFSQTTITNSKHDLSDPAGTNKICIFCHTPHNASANSVSLWNRSLPVQSTFTMYSSPTIDMTIDATGPQGTSLACLSCHDGTIATDQFNGGPGGAADFITGNKKIGPDLSDDHPISISYDITADTAFNAAAGTPKKVGTLPLFTNDNVECATCHSVHDDSNGDFLRMSNNGSAMCLTCHIK